MKTKALSASRLKTWLQCKYKYGCIYHKLASKQIEPPKEYFAVGSAAHHALECAGKMVIEGDLKAFTKDDIELITSKYIEECSRLNLGDEAVIYDGFNLLLTKLDRFEFDHKIISLEDRFNVEIAGVPLIGAMDKVVEFNADSLCVIDYKTSKSVLTDDEVETDIQLSLYDAAARKLFPGYNNYSVCLDYLRFFPKHSKRTEEQRYSFIQLLKVNYKLILEAKKKDLVPELNKFCPWCEYVDVCPAIKEIKDNIPDHQMFDDENTLADSYDKMRTLSKILELKQKDIKSILVGKIRATKNTKALTEDFNVFIRQTPRVSYDPSVLYNIIGADDLIKCVTVVNKKLDVLIKTGVITKEEARAISNVSYTSAILDVRRKKK
jgi:putative RecB family exonuclease